MYNTCITYIYLLTVVTVFYCLLEFLYSKVHLFSISQFKIYFFYKDASFGSYCITSIGKHFN